MDLQYSILVLFLFGACLGYASSWKKAGLACALFATLLTYLGVNLSINVLTDFTLRQLAGWSSIIILLNLLPVIVLAETFIVYFIIGGIAGSIGKALGGSEKIDKTGSSA